MTIAASQEFAQKSEDDSREFEEHFGMRKEVIFSCFWPLLLILAIFANPQYGAP